MPFTACALYYRANTSPSARVTCSTSYPCDDAAKLTHRSLHFRSTRYKPRNDNITVTKTHDVRVRDKAVVTNGRHDEIGQSTASAHRGSDEQSIAGAMSRAFMSATNPRSVPAISYTLSACGICDSPDQVPLRQRRRLRKLRDPNLSAEQRTPEHLHTTPSASLCGSRLSNSQQR